MLLASLSALPSVPDLWHRGRRRDPLTEWPPAETLNSSWMATWPREKERRPSISETMNPSLTHPSIQKIHIEHWIIQSLGQKQHTQTSIWGQEWMKGLFTKVWVRLKERNMGWWSTPWLVNSRRIGTLPWPKGEKKKWISDVYTDTERMRGRRSNQKLTTTRTIAIGPCFSKWGSQTSSSSGLTWELVSNVNTWAPPQTYCIRNSAGGASKLGQHNRTLTPKMVKLQMCSLETSQKIKTQNNYFQGTENPENTHLPGPAPSPRQ